MKVLILTTVMAPYRIDLFNELGKKISLTVCFEQLQDKTRNNDWYKNSFKNFKPIILKNSNKSLKKIKWDFIKELNKKYDVVIFYEYSTITSIVSIFKCQLRGIKYLINCDGAIIEKKSIKDIIKKICISKADGLLANGNSAKNYFLTYGAKEKNIYLHKFSGNYKNEILTEPIDYKKKIVLRKKLNLDFKRLYICVGAFTYRKGFDLLLNALIDTSLNDVGYVLIGGGENKNEYVEFVKKNKLQNVKILDFMSKEELLKYYDASDAFVFPTRYDIWGLVVNEAMSRGLPVISTNKCMAAVELVNKKNGIIIESNSVSSLKSAILKFNKFNNEKLYEMGCNSIKKIKDYNIENLSDEHVNVIKKIIERV